MVDSLKTAKVVAESLHDLYMTIGDYGEGVKIDVVDVVNKLGGTVYKQGYVGINGNSMTIDETSGTFDIYVSVMDTEERQRFTIAHELGHYFMHYLPDTSGKPETKYYRKSYAQGGQIEYEANIFAASFLMPESKFRQRFEEREKNLGMVAEDFGVSIAAAEVRARSLGLLR